MKAISNFIIVLLIIVCTVTTTAAVLGNMMQQELKQAYSTLEDKYIQMYAHMLNEEWSNADNVYFMED